MGSALAVGLSPTELKDAAVAEVRELKARHTLLFAQSVELRKQAVNTSCRSCKGALRARRDLRLAEAREVRLEMHEATRRAAALGAGRQELGDALGCSQSTLSLVLAKGSR